MELNRNRKGVGTEYIQNARMESKSDSGNANNP